MPYLTSNFSTVIEGADISAFPFECISVFIDVISVYKTLA